MQNLPADTPGIKMTSVQIDGHCKLVVFALEYWSNLSLFVHSGSDDLIG